MTERIMFSVLVVVYVVVHFVCLISVLYSLQLLNSYSLYSVRSAVDFSTFIVLDYANYNA
jgi:hypothetical protein